MSIVPSCPPFFSYHYSLRPDWFPFASTPGLNHKTLLEIFSNREIYRLKKEPGVLHFALQKLTGEMLLTYFQRRISLL